VVHSESKRKGNLLLFSDFVVVETNPWFDSESGHHYLKTPHKGGFFALQANNIGLPVVTALISPPGPLPVVQNEQPRTDYIRKAVHQKRRSQKRQRNSGLKLID
jgi:hypothetical protein